MKLAALLLLAAAAFADVSVPAGEQTVTRSIREGNAYPWSGTVDPQRAFFTITSTDSWTLTRTGGLATACGGSPCFKLRNAATGTETSGATGSMTVAIDPGGQGAENLDVGEHTGTVVIDPSTGSNVNISIAWTVVTREPYLSFSYPASYPVGCSNSNAAYPHLDTCDIPNEYPPASGFTIPAQGASYTDPVFGYTVTRLTGAGNVHSYSTRTALNANETLAMLGDTASPDIWQLSDSTKVYNDQPGSINGSTWWHWSDPNKYIYISGAEIIEVTLGVGSASLADFGGTYTTLSDGGTNDISSDGWISLIATTENTVCALNLNGLTEANKASKIFCASYPAESLFNIDFPLIGAADAVTGERYVVLLAEPKQVHYRVNVAGGVLTKLGNFGEQPQRVYPNDDDGICETGETCYTVPHIWVMNDSRGTSFVYSFTEVWGDKTYLATALLAAGANQWRPVEEGGGLRFLYPDASGASNTDTHFGASGVGWFVASYYGNSNGIHTRVIATATAANPSRVTTTTAHGWSTGQVVVIGSSSFVCHNISSTITVVSTTTFDIDSANCTGAGTYNANSGIVAVGTSPTDSPNRGEVVVTNPVLGIVKRIAHHRSKPFCDPNTMPCNDADVPVISYNGAPKCSIGRLAKYIVCSTNFGVPEVASTIVIETGITLTPAVSPRISGGARLSGGATIR